MDKNAFKEQDKAQLVAFLNHIASHATFTHTTQQAIDFFKLLSFMQQTLISKVDSHILEIKGVRHLGPQPPQGEIKE